MQYKRKRNLKHILRAIRTTYGRTSIMKNGNRIKGKLYFCLFFSKNIVTPKNQYSQSIVYVFFDSYYAVKSVSTSIG